MCFCIQQGNVVSSKCLDLQKRTSNIEELNCDSGAHSNDIWNLKPSLQCDNIEVQQDIQNNYLNPDEAKWTEENVSNDVVAQRSTHKRDSASIDSYDSGIVTSPTASHASDNSNGSSCHSGSKTSNSKNVSYIDSVSDKINANSNVTTDGNGMHLENSDKTTKLKDTCTEIALAIYQRYVCKTKVHWILGHTKIIYWIK